VIVPLALALSLTAPPDKWFGADKLKHFFIAAFTQSVAYSALQVARVRHDRALAAAWGVTAAVSVAKELHDRRSYGVFSVRDLAWDAAGAGAATLLIQRTVRSPAETTTEEAASSSLSPVAPLLSTAAPDPILRLRALPVSVPRR
jgi:uncharacterized protein YfiM (DUF2279 family)